MEIALMYESQLKKLIDEIGESVVDSVYEINDIYDQTYEKHQNRNWTEVSLKIIFFKKMALLHL